MQLREFFAASRVFIVAGKGGVGKTTVTATLAAAAARAGLRTLIVEVEGKSGIAAMFGAEPLGYAEEVLLPTGPEVPGRVTARTLTADDALLEYLEDRGMRRVSRRLLSTGAIDVVSTAVPGIEDILVLGKVKQLERSGDYDVILLDAPAAGHAITFLNSAHGLRDAVASGPIHTQAQDVIDLLSDPQRCTVVLVTLAEETPVNEVAETAYALEDRVGVSLGPIIVNAMYPVLAGLDVDPFAAAARSDVTLDPALGALLSEAAAFRVARQQVQHDQVTRLGTMLPLPQIHLPFLFTASIGATELEQLVAAFASALDGVPA